MASGTTEHKHPTPGARPAALELRVAMLAAGAALLGALVGGFSAFGASVYQAQADRSLAMRQERLEAYSGLFTAFARFEAAAGDVETAASGGEQARREAVEKLCATTDQLYEPYTAVLLLGADRLSVYPASAANQAQKVCTAARASGDRIDDSKYQLYQEFKLEVIRRMRADLGY